MATDKRYYWMKLSVDFMSSDMIDYFMGEPDGANYVVLYQMLCLKTINTDGRLASEFGTVIIPYDIPKIQRDLKWFSADTIRVALNLYKAAGLIYEDIDGVLVITDHSSLVGSETSAAARMRKSRSNKTESIPERVTQCEQSANIVTPEIEIETETEIEKEKDIENITVSKDTVCRTKDVRRVMDAWNQLGLTQVTRITSESTRGKLLRGRVREYGVDGVLEAIRKIAKSKFLHGQNARGWVITFDWFLKPNNFVKVKDGNYDNHESGKADASSIPLHGEEDVPF